MSQQHPSRALHRKSLSIEALEKRELLAGDAVAFQHNYLNRYDVNNDRLITARDVLAVTNQMNRGGEAEQADTEGGGMYYDVNADHDVTAVDALGVINAISRGEEVGELIELLLTARDLNDDAIVPDANGEINVEVGEVFDLEVSYDDLRLFNDRLGAFQLLVDISVNQAGVLSPVLNETQRLTIGGAIQTVPSTSVTFTIENLPPGVAQGSTTYESNINGGPLLLPGRPQAIDAWRPPSGPAVVAVATIGASQTLDQVNG